jgi:BNR/Asp-box repeat
MTRLVLGRRTGVVAFVLVAGLVVLCTAALTGAFAGTSNTAQTNSAKQQFAQHLLKTEAAQLMTWPAQAFLRIQATGDRQLTPALAGRPALPSGTAGGAAAPAVPSANLRNVRVNNPALDTHEADQTTQSETTIAVAGSHVAVGYNDSQQTGLFFTAGSDITGYAYSANGGKTFTDGGVLPNAPEFNNLGDPWMASGRNGTMYYATLAGDNLNFNLDVAVARSTNGGKTWSAPVPVFRPPFAIAYFGDKDALAVGPDPVVHARDNLYVSYDDFSFDTVTGQATTGLPVARSTDGGRTWHLAYADKFTLPTTGCSFQQYIGATPIVDKVTGTLYVTAEKIAVDDPNCTGAPATLSESIFKSTDGGKTFGPGVKIADVTAATPDGLLFLGPGRYARTIEFPSPAIRGGTIYVAWNDGGQGGHSHIRLATSTNGGSTWSVRFVTNGGGDEVQPALSADSHGLHLLYYHRYPNNTIDVLIGNSLNGTSFITKRVTSQPFRGTLTVPQFDPIIAFGYMGDYIANVSRGSRDYFAWGDNRGSVTDFLYPHGRNDPDVFFAKR